MNPTDPLSGFRAPIAWEAFYPMPEFLIIPDGPREHWPKWEDFPDLASPRLKVSLSVEMYLFLKSANPGSFPKYRPYSYITVCENIRDYIVAKKDTFFFGHDSMCHVGGDKLGALLEVNVFPRNQTSLMIRPHMILLGLAPDPSNWGPHPTFERRGGAEFNLRYHPYTGVQQVVRPTTMRPIAPAPFVTPGPVGPRAQPVGSRTTTHGPTDGAPSGPTNNVQRLRSTRVFPIGPASNTQSKPTEPKVTPAPAGPTDPLAPKITAVGYITTAEGMAIAHAKLDEAFAKNQVMVFRRDAQKTAELRNRPVTTFLGSTSQTSAGLIKQPALGIPESSDPLSKAPEPSEKKVETVRKEPPARPQSPTPDKEREIGSPEPGLSCQDELMRDLESSSSGSPTICRIDYELHESEEEDINPGGPPSDHPEPQSGKSDDTLSPRRPSEEDPASGTSGAGNARNLDNEAVDLRTSNRPDDATGVTKVSNKRGRPPKASKDNEPDSKKNKS